uniref:Elongator complex protein 6 n=1 Tax=Photinus pyralis TaxID=7054 RepID=A0A1Y1KF09_PHOPY
MECKWQESNPLLTAINLQPSDRIVSTFEQGLSDANFITTNLMKKIFSEDGKICLLILHNTIGHYHNVLKRLGHDLMQKLKDGHATTIEPLKNITDFLTSDKETLVKHLFLAIRDKMNKLLVSHPNGRVYLIIDDLSHLLDLDVDVKYMTSFINYCINLVQNDRVHVIVSYHIANANDKVISNCLRYVSNLVIDISPLKTGISHDVTGIISIERRHSTDVALRKSVLHYKAYDREIKTFAPGEAIYHLYK